MAFNNQIRIHLSRKQNQRIPSHRELDLRLDPAQRLRTNSTESNPLLMTVTRCSNKPILTDNRQAENPKIIKLAELAYLLR